VRGQKEPQLNKGRHRPNARGCHEKEDVTVSLVRDRRSDGGILRKAMPAPPTGATEIASGAVSDTDPEDCLSSSARTGGASHTESAALVISDKSTVVAVLVGVGKC